MPPRPINLPRSLPVKSIRLETKIVSQVATTHVEQIFRNDTDATLEGTYFFPLPESASISEFAIWDGDRRLVGEVRSREEARRFTIKSSGGNVTQLAGIRGERPFPGEHLSHSAACGQED
jgi:hypothetical protein